MAISRHQVVAPADAIRPSFRSIVAGIESSFSAGISCSLIPLPANPARNNTAFDRPEIFENPRRYRVSVRCGHDICSRWKRECRIWGADPAWGGRMKVAVRRQLRAAPGIAVHSPQTPNSDGPWRSSAVFTTGGASWSSGITPRRRKFVVVWYQMILHPQPVR